jgi:hypothetical protein
MKDVFGWAVPVRKVKVIWWNNCEFSSKHLQVDPLNFLPLNDE